MSVQLATVKTENPELAAGLLSAEAPSQSLLPISEEISEISQQILSTAPANNQSVDSSQPHTAVTLQVTANDDEGSVADVQQEPERRCECSCISHDCLVYTMVFVTCATLFFTSDLFKNLIQ